MFNGKKLLLIVVNANCSEEQIAKALGELAVKTIITPETTPLLLSDSDFKITNNKKFGITRYNVRERFYIAIETLKKVCGSPKAPEFFRNAVRAHVDGHVETQLIKVLLSMTTDERAWLESCNYMYATKFIDALHELNF